MPNIDLSAQATPKVFVGMYGKTKVTISREHGFLIGAIQDAPPGVFGLHSLYPADADPEPITLQFEPSIRRFGVSSTGRVVATQPLVQGYFAPNPYYARTITDNTDAPILAPEFDNQVLSPGFNLLIEKVELSAIGPRTEAWDAMFFTE